MSCNSTNRASCQRNTKYTFVLFGAFFGLALPLKGQDFDKQTAGIYSSLLVQQRTLHSVAVTSLFLQQPHYRPTLASSVSVYIYIVNDIGTGRMTQPLPQGIVEAEEDKLVRAFQVSVESDEPRRQAFTACMQQYGACVLRNAVPLHSHTKLKNPKDKVTEVLEGITFKGRPLLGPSTLSRQNMHTFLIFLVFRQRL